MKKPFFGFVLLCASLSLPVSTNWAQTPANPSPPPSTNAPPRKITYKAAAGSALGARVTGGSRGSGDEAVRLDVLAPDETGLTTEEQPSLFWYQSKPAEASFELTLLEEGKPKPVLQVKSVRSGQAGIQRLKLSDHGKKLTPGVEYRWVVALVTDSANRSKDLIASGFVKRVEATPELKVALAKAPLDAKPAIYAEAGIWHDALATLADLIEAQPNAAEQWRAQRAELLRQVGLSFAADADGKKPKG